MRTLRIGIIGLGVGEQHIAGYQQHPAARVTTLCDIDPDKLTQVLDRHPDCRGTTDPEAVLTDPAIDVVSIASYDDAHYQQVMTALEHDKHIFVEKPICIRPEHARDIRAMLRQRPHLRLSSNLILRACPRFIELRDMIQRGDYGRIISLDGDYNYGRLQKILSGWRGQIPDYSGIFGGGVHLVDLFLWLTEDTPVSVVAYGNRIATTAAATDANSTFRNYDYIAALIRFESGMVARLAVNLGCVHPHFHTLNVFGTKATFFNRMGDAELWTSRDKDHKPTLITTAYPGYRKGQFLERFIDSILDASATPAVSIDEVFASMSVCFAVEQSVHSGRETQVAWL